MELWVLGMDRNLCDRWSLRLEVCRSLQACNSSLFSVQNTNNCCSAVRSIPMHGSYWRTMADNLAYQRKNNSSICHLCPELYEHFLHRLLHPSTFFHFSYFHQFISFLIHRLRNTCDFFMKIEHYVGKVDLLTVFSIPLIYLKKKVWMFFKNFNDLLCSRSEKRNLVRNLFINSPRISTSEEVWQLLLSSSWKWFQHLISTVASWKLVNGTLKSIYFVLFWYLIHSTCLHISFPSNNS